MLLKKAVSQQVQLVNDIINDSKSYWQYDADFTSKYNKLEFNINVFPTNEIDDNGFNVFIIEFVRIIGDGIIMANCLFEIEEKLTGIDHRRKPYIYVNDDKNDCEYNYDSLQ